MPGVGMATASSVKELDVDGMDLEILVKQAVSEWERQQQQQQQHEQRQQQQHLKVSRLCRPAPALPPRTQQQQQQRHLGSCIWLDVQSPTEEDINALACIFDIGGTTVRHLLSVKDGKLPSPECMVTDTALYLCWAETTATGASAKEYISRGTVDCSRGEQQQKEEEEKVSPREQPATALAGGYIPVPPWLQPSATQILGQMNLGKRRRRKPELSEHEAATLGLETAQREQVREMLALLDRPIVANKERTRAALQRWGPSYEQWWQEVLLSIRDQQPRQPNKAARMSERLGRGTQELIGYRLVQAWTRGAVLLTFRTESSHTLDTVMRELARPSLRLRNIDALSVVEHFMADWASTTHDCLDIIERYTDRLDHDLTRPLQVLSTEAASWTPVIARCRKVALALLRHCQANEAVVIQLCSAIRTLRQSSARGLDTDCTLHSKAHKSWQHAGDALWRQHSDASAILKKYKKAEQRL
ncbi:hypothetical protein GGI21_004086, partial [Coemansia aciculifera]